MSAVTFLAALAGQNSAAKWLGMDDEGAAKIVFETDQTQCEEVIKLRGMGKTLLRVTVEIA